MLNSSWLCNQEWWWSANVMMGNGHVILCFPVAQMVELVKCVVDTFPISSNIFQWMSLNWSACCIWDARWCQHDLWVHLSCVLETHGHTVAKCCQSFLVTLKPTRGSWWKMIFFQACNQRTCDIWWYLMIFVIIDDYCNTVHICFVLLLQSQVPCFRRVRVQGWSEDHEQQGVAATKTQQSLFCIFQEWSQCATCPPNCARYSIPCIELASLPDAWLPVCQQQEERIRKPQEDTLEDANTGFHNKAQLKPEAPAGVQAALGTVIKLQTVDYSGESFCWLFTMQTLFSTRSVFVAICGNMLQYVAIVFAYCIILPWSANICHVHFDVGICRKSLGEQGCLMHTQKLYPAIRSISQHTWRSRSHVCKWNPFEPSQSMFKFPHVGGIWGCL